jgi:hypothetical protein
MRKRDKLKNIEQANLMLERHFVIERQRLVISETIFLSDLTGLEFHNILKESCQEIGLKINLNENKDLLKEGVTVMIIGAALASGKFLDLIGSLFRNAYNLFVEKSGLMEKMRESKCTDRFDEQEEQSKCIKILLKKQSIDKTWFEKAGEWIHKNIIMNIFKIVATVLIGIFAPSFLTSKEDGMNTELIEKVANTLFYVSITIFGLLAIKTLVANGIKGLATLPGVVESVAVGTKGYEIVLLIFAAILILKKKVKENNPSNVAHKLGECLEGGGKVSSLLKNIKKMTKDSGLREKMYLCVDLQEH